ncbi:MAG: hypothetical protein QGI86_09105 [Candidatus Poribacteria bacterium]|jgi:hypothetical protein|nr:hypothetical protein [Candidatus Poribacteria bacterium]MDP6995671.1 hypothetical protein [Candidatus Poribacteria bacterium]
MIPFGKYGWGGNPVNLCVAFRVFDPPDNVIGSMTVGFGVCQDPI